MKTHVLLMLLMSWVMTHHSLTLHVEWQSFVRRHSIQEPDVKPGCYLHPTLSGFAIYSDYYCSCFIEAIFQIGCGCACGHPLADLKATQRQLRIIIIHSQQTVQMLQVQNDNIQWKFTSGYLWFMQSACIIIAVFRISEGIAINGI